MLLWWKSVDYNNQYEYYTIIDRNISALDFGLSGKVGNPMVMSSEVWDEPNIVNEWSVDFSKYIDSGENIQVDISGNNNSYFVRFEIALYVFGGGRIKFGVVVEK